MSLVTLKTENLENECWEIKTHNIHLTFSNYFGKFVLTLKTHKQTWSTYLTLTLYTCTETAV